MTNLSVAATTNAAATNAVPLCSDYQQTITGFLQNLLATGDYTGSVEILRQATEIAHFNKDDKKGEYLDAYSLRDYVYRGGNSDGPESVRITLNKLYFAGQDQPGYRDTFDVVFEKNAQGVTSVKVEGNAPQGLQKYLQEKIADMPRKGQEFLWWQETLNKVLTSAMKAEAKKELAGNGEQAENPFTKNFSNNQVNRLQALAMVAEAVKFDRSRYNYAISSPSYAWPDLSVRVDLKVTDKPIQDTLHVSAAPKWNDGEPARINIRNTSPWLANEVEKHLHAALDSTPAAPQGTPENRYPSWTPWKTAAANSLNAYVEKLPVASSHGASDGVDRDVKTTLEAIAHGFTLDVAGTMTHSMTVTDGCK